MISFQYHILKRHLPNYLVLQAPFKLQYPMDFTSLFFCVLVLSSDSTFFCLPQMVLRTGSVYDQLFFPKLHPIHFSLINHWFLVYSTGLLGLLLTKTAISFGLYLLFLFYACFFVLLYLIYHTTCELSTYFSNYFSFSQ